MKGLTTLEVRGEMVILRGISKLFYQEGIPISMINDMATQAGYKISWFHFADDLLKQGWKADRILARLREEVADSGGDVSIDMDKIRDFVYASYEDQREMIFQYLWASKEDAFKWFKFQLTGK